MKIESVTLSNFRAFVEPVELRLRPLTLLFGYNSAGKSALLRALPLIADSLNSKEEAPWDLLSPAARGAAFQDFLPDISLSPSRKFSLKLRLLISEGNQTKTLLLSWVLLDLPELRRQVVERFEFKIEDEVRVEAEWKPEWARPDGTGPVRPGNRYSVTASGISALETSLSFRGLLPDFESAGKVKSHPFSRIANFLSALRDEGPKVQWLSSVRRTPERSMQWPGSPPSSLAPDGAGASEVLAYDQLARGSLLSEVSSWYEEHMGFRLKAPPGELIRLMVEPVAKPLVQVPLQDTGEGLIQVLPVLVAAARLRSTGHRLPRILAVEEPESHLHPRLHAALTEHFCRWASLPDPPQIVIETHSENILLRVQIAIAEGTLSRDLVAVYWIRQDPEGRSRAELVKFDLQGRPLENWPPGVFHENLDQARKLLAARRDRQV